MTEDEKMDIEASFDSSDLEELATRVKGVLDIQDRKYGFPSKTYRACFVGNEAVKKLVDEEIAGFENLTKVYHLVLREYFEEKEKPHLIRTIIKKLSALFRGKL